MSNKEDNFGDEEAGTSASGSGGSFRIPQPNRDLVSNWAVDLAKNLEEYLLKICSGEINADQSQGNHSINFAEAALLLQGSVQVYSRKVEYLYTLVLQALEFISQKRQDHQESASVQPDGRNANTVVEEENEIFLGLDDVPVEEKNCLDDGLVKNCNLNSFVKPPGNLLVLEGDHIDTCDDASELESFLLSTCDFFGDFLLLDPCDAGAVFDYLKGKTAVKEHHSVHKGSSARRRARDNLFSSPVGRSEGSDRKSNLGKNKGADLNQPSESNFAFEADEKITWSGPHAGDGHPECDRHYGEETGFGCSDVRDDFGCSDVRDDSDNDEEDDPWKPLNPHEPGNLKIKPFKKVKVFGRKAKSSSNPNTLTSQFPLAKLDGTISPEFTETLELQLRSRERTRASLSPPLFEKLRQSLLLGEPEICNDFGDPDYENNDDGGENDLPDFDLPQDTCNIDTDVPLHNGKQGDGSAHFDDTEALGQDDLDPHATLEDLCRSHLDTLLANIAETEKQTELATLVSTWKQRIEHSLEEQESRPPFDIHCYGNKILETLSLEADSGGSMSFTDIVKGQAKHDIGRTFSALLQLVNNGSVDLDTRQSKAEPVSYTVANPFYVRLLDHVRRGEQMKNFSTKKRAKSPTAKGVSKASSESTSLVNSPHWNGKFTVKLGKASVIRCTPDGKRRRRSRLIEPADVLL